MYKQTFINDFANNTEKGILDAWNASEHDRSLVGKIIFADYTYEDYSGSAHVVYEGVDGQLYEVHGSHCSCYGLEDQWEPELTSIEYFKERIERGAITSKEMIAALGLNSVLFLEEAKSIIASYTEAKMTYEYLRGKMTEEHSKAYATLIGEQFGDFALVVRGYTPSFNDGEPCEHHFDYSLCVEWQGYGFSFDDLYLEPDCREDTGEFFEYNEELKTTINSKFKGGDLFFKVISEYADFIDDINETNYEVRVKFKDGELEFNNEWYDCGY